MSVDKLVDSTQLDTDLTSVANAIRTKGGTSAALAFPAGFVSAIDAIPTGGGSSVQTGTFTVASDIRLYSNTPVSLTVGFSGQPDYIRCWMDLSDWNSLAAESKIVNNRWYMFAVSRNPTVLFPTLPPLRKSASEDLSTTYANASFIIGTTVYAGPSSDPSNTSGVAVTYPYLGLQTNGLTGVSINNDGTLTLYGANTQYILAAKYHYVAVNGFAVFPC